MAPGIAGPSSAIKGPVTVDHSAIQSQAPHLPESASRQLYVSRRTTHRWNRPMMVLEPSSLRRSEHTVTSSTFPLPTHPHHVGPTALRCVHSRVKRRDGCRHQVLKARFNCIAHTSLSCVPLHQLVADNCCTCLTCTIPLWASYWSLRARFHHPNSHPLTVTSAGSLQQVRHRSSCRWQAQVSATELLP